MRRRRRRSSPKQRNKIKKKKKKTHSFASTQKPLYRPSFPASGGHARQIAAPASEVSAATVSFPFPFRFMPGCEAQQAASAVVTVRRAAKMACNGIYSVWRCQAMVCGCAMVGGWSYNEVSVSHRLNTLSPSMDMLDQIMFFAENSLYRVKLKFFLKRFNLGILVWTYGGLFQ